MSVGIDASLTLAWYFADARTSGTDEVLDRVADGGAVVPNLWRLEVANGFQAAIRRKQIGARYRDASPGELARLPITVDPDTNSHAWATTLRPSEQFKLSMYDAGYLELAGRRGLPLETRDQELRKAAPALGAALLGLA